MFTRLLMTNGKDVVSAIKPDAIINGKTILSLKLSVRTIARTIGVRISAAPSLANSAADTCSQQGHEGKTSVSRYLWKSVPYEVQTISKKPISSRISEIIIRAINVNVAFQTMPVTSRTSPKLTTPTRSAIMAPVIV